MLTFKQDQSKSPLWCIKKEKGKGSFVRTYVRTYVRTCVCVCACVCVRACVCEQLRRRNEFYLTTTNCVNSLQYVSQDMYVN